MSKNYDNWERLVGAVIKREEDWQLCHQLSIRTISMCSEASSISDFGSSSNYFLFEIEKNQESDEKVVRNYDNWERLVAAVIKRQKIWELLHGPSISPCSEISPLLYTEEYSADQKPIPKLDPVEVDLKRIRELSKGRFGNSILTQLQWGVKISNQQVLRERTRLVMKTLQSKVLKETEEEFREVFGYCRHENVAVPRAYYFSNDGNFIFNDYHCRGSLYDMLQGKSKGRPNWESRIKIAIGAARGIAHIHGQYAGKLALGNIKSTNIFLNSQLYGCVSDFGLAGIMVRPERWFVIPQYKNPSQENDVYSFGVVLLELLTRKSPKELQAGLGGDIVKWAYSITHEDWRTKLFDQSLWSSELPYQRLLPLCDELDMLRFEEQLELHSKTGVEMLEMLQVAMRCLAKLPQDRPKMFQVVSMLEDICEPVPPRSLITPTLNCCLLTHY